MIISSITASGRGKSRICLESPADPAFSSFVLRDKDILALHLREEQEISSETMEEIVRILTKDCLAKSGFLLKSQDYTKERLKKKLKEADFPLPVVEDVLSEVEDAGYLNDERYAESFIRSHAGDRSFRKIRQDLKERGVSADLIEDAFRKAGEEGLLEDREEEQIREILHKKRFDAENATWEEKQKLMAGLYRRGFSPEVIRRAMGEEGEE